MRVMHKRRRSQPILVDKIAHHLIRMSDGSIRLIAYSTGDMKEGCIVDIARQELYRAVLQIPAVEMIEKLGTVPEARKFMDDLAKVLGVKTP